MREILLALSVLSFTLLPAFADTGIITTPTEVGTTSMSPGQYIVTDQVSSQCYSLTITSKGTMILGPAPAGTRAATIGAAVTTAAPAATATTAAPGAATTAATTAATQTSTVNKLIDQGLEKGASELLKFGGKSALDKIIP